MGLKAPEVRRCHVPHSGRIAEQTRGQNPEHWGLTSSPILWLATRFASAGCPNVRDGASSF